MLFFALAPFPADGHHDVSGVNMGSGARRLRPVALSSSAKRRANTSSDTIGSVRRSPIAGVGIAETAGRTVPRVPVRASPSMRSGTIMLSATVGVSDISGEIPIAQVRPRIEFDRDRSPGRDAIAGVTM